MSTDKQHRMIGYFLDMGYTRVPRSRSPAIMQMGDKEHRVYPDGTCETLVRGRMLIGRGGETNTRHVRRAP